MDPHWLRRWLRRLLAALGLGGVVLLLRQLLKPRIASHVSSHQKPTKRRFAAFLSHCKADAAMERRRLAAVESGDFPEELAQFSSRRAQAPGARWGL